jgi:hypothetical protein
MGFNSKWQNNLSLQSERNGDRGRHSGKVDGYTVGLGALTLCATGFGEQDYLTLKRECRSEMRITYDACVCFSD